MHCVDLQKGGTNFGFGWKLEGFRVFYVMYVKNLRIVLYKLSFLLISYFWSYYICCGLVWLSWSPAGKVEGPGGGVPC